MHDLVEDYIGAARRLALIECEIREKETHKVLLKQEELSIKVWGRRSPFLWGRARTREWLKCMLEIV
jgi:hypothetical protein